jgi:hypothetical protein
VVLPDGVRCPLSTAVVPPAIDVALLCWVRGEERELVGCSQGRKRGARRRGIPEITLANLRETTGPLHQETDVSI